MEWHPVPPFFKEQLTLLQGIPCIAAYLDDILITGATEARHIENLEQVLKRLPDAGLRLKRGKCVFMAPSVTYLGHTITAEGLRPVEDKVRAKQAQRTSRNSAHFWAW